MDPLNAIVCCVVSMSPEIYFFVSISRKTFEFVSKYILYEIGRCHTQNTEESTMGLMDTESTVGLSQDIEISQKFVKL